MSDLIYDYTGDASVKAEQQAAVEHIYGAIMKGVTVGGGATALTCIARAVMCAAAEVLGGIGVADAAATCAGADATSGHHCLGLGINVATIGLSKILRMYGQEPGITERFSGLPGSFNPSVQARFYEQGWIIFSTGLVLLPSYAEQS